MVGPTAAAADATTARRRLGRQSSKSREAAQIFYDTLHVFLVHFRKILFRPYLVFFTNM